MRPAFLRITVLMLSPIDPRCTGMCGALAMRLPSTSKRAQEKSSRSFMLADGERLAQKDRRSARPSHYHVFDRDGWRARIFRLFIGRLFIGRLFIGRLFIGGRFGEGVRLADGFDRDRFDDDLPAWHQEAEAPLVSRLEIPSHVGDLAERRDERRVRSFVAQMSALA